MTKSTSPKNVIIYQDPAGGVTSFDYDAVGNSTAFTDPNGNTSSSVYDALSRMVASIDPNGNTTSSTFNAGGQMVASTDALGNSVSFSYDALGRQIAIIDPLGNTTEYGYDANGNRTSMTDANGVVTGYEYDSLSRLVAVVENYKPGFGADHETNIRTIYTYDTNGNRLTITDGNGHTSSFSYDDLNRLIQESDPLGNSWQYGYDAVGNRISLYDANGVLTSYNYDAVNQLIAIDYPGTSEDVTFSYDALGRRTDMDDGLGITSWTYDALNRPTAINDPFGDTVGYRYDAVGNRVGLSYPDGKQVEYSYDPANFLAQVTDWNAQSTNYEYDPSGRMTGINRPNGVFSNYAYDGAGRLTEIQHQTGSAPISSFQYAYDPVGNRVQAIDHIFDPTLPPPPPPDPTPLTLDELIEMLESRYADGQIDDQKVYQKLHGELSRAKRALDGDKIKKVAEHLGHFIKELDKGAEQITPETALILKDSAIALLEFYGADPGGLNDFAQLIAEVEGYTAEGSIDDEGLSKKLIDEVEKAKKEYDKNNLDKAAEHLRHFMEELDKGVKHITVEAAEKLQDSAFALLELIDAEPGSLNNFAQLIAEVEEYFAQGSIDDEGLSKKLIDEVGKAQKEYDKNDPEKAAEHLGHFVKELDKGTEHVTPEIVAILKDSVTELLSLFDPEPGNPITFEELIAGVEEYSVDGSISDQTLRDKLYDQVEKAWKEVDKNDPEKAAEHLWHIIEELEKGAEQITAESADALKESVFEILGSLGLDLDILTSLDQLGRDVEDLYTQGQIDDAKNRDKLLGEVNQAQKEFVSGRNEKTVEKLDTFIALVEKEGDKHIDPATAESLIDSAQAIKDLLASGLTVKTKSSGVLAAPIRLDFPALTNASLPLYGPVTIDYTYDPLYRLTAADYDSGETYHYTYDAVGNRLTQETLAGINSYAYDLANRMTAVDGVAYTYDANGNLLDDGANTYGYDYANRMVYYNGTTSYSYNGLGDRHQQNGVNYTLDLNTGLTQVLSDGTNTYLYGNGRVSQAGSTTEYFLGDALGSVRQLTDSTGAVTLTQSYAPFGEIISSEGTGTSAYQFTSEARDANGLTYLRARYLDSGIGRFTQRDPSGLEANLYLYAGGNPVNRTDRTGLMSGLEAFGRCLNVHSGHKVFNNTSTLNGMTAQDAVDLCKLAYSRDAWTSMPFGANTNSAHNLFGVYVNESSETNRLIFTAKDALTKELSASYSLMKLRREYMQFGETIGPIESRFNESEQKECITDYNPYQGTTLSVPLTCFLGSFYYQFKTVDTYKGTYVGFRIDNRTDLESGTHIAGRFPGNDFGGSVEGLISSKQITGNESILNVMNTKYGDRYVVSILNARSSADTGWYNSSYGRHELGGGNLMQTFVWMEKYDQCDPLSRFGFSNWPWHETEEWINWYITQPIPQWNQPF